jgi:hypothetical protein
MKPCTTGQERDAPVLHGHLSSDVGAFAIFVVAAAILWISAPHNGEFWWSDSPRHALNGVFVKDMIAAFPWRDPARYAMQYYVQYPALTVLFYPPLFYLISAPFYALFGVSHGTALTVVLVHYIALAYGLYLFGCRWLNRSIALAVGLSVMAAPGVALWGRQVMLEIPALAFAVWGVLILRRHAENGKPILLYLGTFLSLCSIYTKISAIFLLPVVGLMLLAHRRAGLWRDRHAWLAALFLILGLIPITILTLKFGEVNMQSVLGIPDAEVSRYSLSGWLWYLRRLPEQIGWPLLAAAIAFPFLVAAGRRSRRVDSVDLILLCGWLVFGYVFFSLIDLKEARHSTLILPPLLLAAGLTFGQIPRAGAAIALAVTLGTGIYTWYRAPVFYVEGYREAAEWIARDAPKGSVILFSGNRDGSFIFNLRTLDANRDFYTVRADKLLLSLSVRRELGVTEKTLSEAEIGDMLDKYGVTYVVAQTDFWTDLDVMARLQSVLRSPHFAEAARLPVVANFPAEDKELRIYRNRHEVASGAVRLNLDLPMVGRSVDGQIGEQR